MYGQHEPSNEFVEKLEWEIAGEVRRRNRHSQVPAWIPQSSRKVALALSGIVLVSMALGAAGVGAAYQVQTNRSRDVLLSTFQQRAEVARQRLKLATDSQKETERRISLLGMSQADILDARAKVAETDAQVKSLESQIEEIRITGREPSNEISAPLVSGRDFVTERLQIDIAVPAAALEAERQRLRDAEKSVSLGLASPQDADEARARLVEIEAGIAFRKTSMEVRQQFLAHKVDAATAELRILEAQAEERERAVSMKIELARTQAQNIAAQVRIGAKSTMDQAEANMRLEELEMEVAKAEMDLARARKQLDQRHKGRQF
jgi:hypothetical protein